MTTAPRTPPTIPPIRAFGNPEDESGGGTTEVEDEDGLPSYKIRGM